MYAESGGLKIRQSQITLPNLLFDVTSKFQYLEKLTIDWKDKEKLINLILKSYRRSLLVIINTSNYADNAIKSLTPQQSSLKPVPPSLSQS
jgi:hypothetical protein